MSPPGAMAKKNQGANEGEEDRRRTTAATRREEASAPQHRRNTNINKKRRQPPPPPMHRQRQRCLWMTASDTLHGYDGIVGDADAANTQTKRRTAAGFHERRTPDDGDDGDGGDGRNINDSCCYDSIFDRHSSRPPMKSMLELCSNSLVIVQEICLTCYLLARHRIAAEEQQREGGGDSDYYIGDIFVASDSDPSINSRVGRSTVAMYVALALVLAYSNRSGGRSGSDPSPGGAPAAASRRSSHHRHHHQQRQQQSRKTKLRQRSVDGLLLAALLRFCAGLLRSLTASYSSDTVQSLACAGMLLHVFACDYSYANGQTKLCESDEGDQSSGGHLSPSSDNDNGGEAETTVMSKSADSTTQQRHTQQTTFRGQKRRQKRPSFLGGTVSLNAALFSTTLLVSRLHSSLSAYFFVSISIVMFAFYPTTRNAVAAAYPAATSRKSTVADMHADIPLYIFFFLF